MRRPLLLTLAAGFFATAAAQQTVPLRFIPASLDPCGTGEEAITTRDVIWSLLAGEGCLVPTVGADSSTLAFDDLPAVELGVYAVGIGDGGGDAVNVVPGARGEYFLVELAVTGDVDAVGPFDLSGGAGGGGQLGASLAGFNVDADDAERIRQISLDAFGRGGDCGAIVEGGSRLDLATLPLTIDAEASSVTLGLALTYTPLPEATVLGEIVVPASAREGDGYGFDLPAGYVALAPAPPTEETGFENYGAIPVQLAEPAAEAQDIALRKRGGDLVASTFVQLVPGEAADGTPHRVTLELDDVAVCIGTNEVLVRDGVTLSLSGVGFDYGAATSCLGVGEGALVVIPADARQTLGDAEAGMTLWAGGGAMRVESGAELTLSGIIAVGSLTFGEVATEGGDGRLEVASGASVTVSAESRDLASAFGEGGPDVGGDARIVVEVAEGGSFDMSAAPAEVQALFRVEGATLVKSAIPPGDYRLAANVVAAGQPLRLLVGDGAAPLSLLELVDGAGRIVASVARPRGDLELTALGAGLYVVRLADERGRVAALRAVVGR